MTTKAWLPDPDWLATGKLPAYFAPMQHEEERMDRRQAQQRYLKGVREGIGLPSVGEVLSNGSRVKNAITKNLTPRRVHDF